MEMRLILFAALTLLTCGGVAQPVPPHTVYGEVTQDGTGVSGAVVEAVHDGSEEASTQSKADGSYVLDVPYDNSYSGEKLTIEANSNATGLSVVFKTGNTSKRDIEIGGQPHSVRGYVKGSSGEGLEDVSIAFLNGGAEAASKSTNNRGFYAVNIPFSTEYQGQNLDVSIDGDTTDRDIEFVSGGSTQLNYTKDTQDDTDSQNDDNQEEQTSVDTSQDGEAQEENIDQAEPLPEDTDQPGEQKASADLYVTGLEVPSTATIGSIVDVNVSFENRGPAPGNTSKELLVDGETASTLETEIPAETSKSVVREISISDVGSHTISVGELSSNVNITERRDSSTEGESSGGVPLPMLLLGISALLFVSIGIYELVSRETGNEESSGSDASGSGADPRTQRHQNNLRYTEDKD
jgi:hypothetical protein